MYIYIYTCIHTHTHTHARTYTHTQTHTHTHTHTHTNTHTHTQTYTHIHTHTQTHTYIYIYIYIYIRIDFSKASKAHCKYSNIIQIHTIFLKSTLYKYSYIHRYIQCFSTTSGLLQSLQPEQKRTHSIQNTGPIALIIHILKKHDTEDF